MHPDVGVHIRLQICSKPSDARGSLIILLRPKALDSSRYICVLICAQTWALTWAFRSQRCAFEMEVSGTIVFLFKPCFVSSCLMEILFCPKSKKKKNHFKMFEKLSFFRIFNFMPVSWNDNFVRVIFRVLYFTQPILRLIKEESCALSS